MNAPKSPESESCLTAEGRALVAELRAEAEAKALEARSAAPVVVVTRQPSNSQPHCFDAESRSTSLEPVPLPGGVYRRHVPVVKSTQCPWCYELDGMHLFGCAAERTARELEAEKNASAQERPLTGLCEKCGAPIGFGHAFAVSRLRMVEGKATFEGGCSRCALPLLPPPVPLS